MQVREECKGWDWRGLSTRLCYHVDLKLILKVLKELWERNIFWVFYHQVHSSVLAWRIPGTGEPGGLPSMGTHRVGHDWGDLQQQKGSGWLFTVPTCPHSWSGWIRKTCFLGFSLTLSPSAKRPWLRNSSHGCTSWSSFLCAAGITWETPNQMIFLRLCSTLIYLLCKLLSLRHWLPGPNWAKGSVPTLRGAPWPLKRVSADSWDLSPLGQALPLLHFEVVQSSIDEENRAESP